jgi:hypothetical protein
VIVAREKPVATTLKPMMCACREFSHGRDLAIHASLVTGGFLINILLQSLTDYEFQPGVAIIINQCDSDADLGSEDCIAQHLSTTQPSLACVYNGCLPQPCRMRRK